MSSPYAKLGIAIAINAVAMFLLTYVMIASLDHLYFSINKVYMALVMVAPMMVLMLFVMRSMYQNRGLNLILYIVFIGLFVVVFWLIRTQTPVDNERFLRSMIPHHSAAILVCRKAAITDPEIVRLCDEIIKSQEEEIAQMKRILTRY